MQTLNICPIDIFTPYAMSKPSMVEGDDQPNAKHNEDIVIGDVFGFVGFKDLEQMSANWLWRLQGWTMSFYIWCFWTC